MEQVANIEIYACEFGHLHIKQGDDDVAISGNEYAISDVIDAIAEESIYAVHPVHVPEDKLEDCDEFYAHFPERLK